MNKQAKKFPLLTSERLLLRNIKKDDASAIYFLRSDVEVNKFIQRNPTKSIYEAENFISERIKEIANRKVYYWAITLKGTPNLIGSICFWNFNTEKTIAEIGYDLHPNFQGKGIMNESLKLVLDFGFKNLKLKTIEAFTHKGNKSSIRLLKRNQFIQEIDRIDKGFPNNIIFKRECAKHL